MEGSENGDSDINAIVSQQSKEQYQDMLIGVLLSQNRSKGEDTASQGS